MGYIQIFLTMLFSSSTVKGQLSNNLVRKSYRLLALTVPEYEISRCHLGKFGQHQLLLQFTHAQLLFRNGVVSQNLLLFCWLQDSGGTAGL